MQPISRTDARNVRHHSSTPTWWPARRQPLRRCHVNPPSHNPRHDAISMRGGNSKQFFKGGELRRIPRPVIRASPTAPPRGGATAGSSSANLCPSTGHRSRDTRPRLPTRHSCSPAKPTGRPPRTPCANFKGATQHLQRTLLPTHHYVTR